MKLILLASATLACLLGFSTGQAAVTEPHDAQGHETTQTSLGDAAQGALKSATCAACHGEHGVSQNPSFPKLAGQSERYLYKQLKDMKRPADNPSARIVPEMMGFLPTLTDEDLRDLATYYSQQTTTLEGADPALVELGEKIYRSGNTEARVTACTSCHGIQGKGMPTAGIPALSGQHAGYLATQLRAFRAAGRDDLNAERYRRNDENKIMRNVAKGLSDKEIQALASYISGLH